jgi:CAAX prenyl protease-like protein
VSREGEARGEQARAPRRRGGHGFWPYWAPYFSFLLIVSLGSRGEGASALGLSLQVGVPAALLLHFARRGAYPELRGLPGGARGIALDVLVGLAGAALWMAPYVFLPSFQALRALEIPFLQAASEQGLDPARLGEGALASAALALRGLGYGLVTPFVEELFVRSWLSRYVDVLDGPGDFRAVPIARFTRRSLLAVVACFVITHLPWEWPVTLVWVIGTQLWLYHRGHLLAVVIAHAASNLGILATVLLASGRVEGPGGQPLDLWFFL